MAKDKTKPNPPTGLVYEIVSPTIVDLSWNAAIDPNKPGETASGVKGYRVFRDGTKIADLGPVLTHSDPGRTPNRTYRYTVASVDNRNNQSLPSGPVSVTMPPLVTPTNPDVTAPSVPQNLQASANVQVVSLTWSASTDPTVSGAVTSGLKEYRIRRDGVQIATATATAYQDTAPAQSTEYSYRVAAADNADNVSALSDAVTVTTGSTGGGGGDELPAGVTLRDIDGGPTYYADHGMTYATNTANHPSWDDPAFFPIGLWLPPMHSQADATRWTDLGLTAFFCITGNSNLSLLRNNGFSGVVQSGELSEILSNNGSLGNETVGLLTADEPTTYNKAVGAISSVANTHQNGRFWYLQNLWTTIGYGDIEGHSMADICNDLFTPPGGGPQRHIDIVSADAYWCTGDSNIGGPFNPRIIYGLSTQLTSDQMTRGMHYGQMVDKIRPWQAGSYPAPLFQFVENGGPYTENTTAGSYITPAQMNAGAWGNILHGGRALMYFNHSFAGPAVSQDNFAAAYYTSNGIYAQAKATHALIKSLATVINSSFAQGYVTVSPAPSSVTDFSGFDVMAKYHNRGSSPSNKFYIFAMPRWSQTQSNQQATFTIKNTGATQVTVVNESRTVPVTDGGTKFVDTFASAHTVHIYRVD